MTIKSYNIFVKVGINIFLAYKQIKKSLNILKVVWFMENDNINIKIKSNYPYKLFNYTTDFVKNGFV